MLTVRGTWSLCTLRAGRPPLPVYLRGTAGLRGTIARRGGGSHGGFRQGAVVGYLTMKRFLSDGMVLQRSSSSGKAAMAYGSTTSCSALCTWSRLSRLRALTSTSSVCGHRGVQRAVDLFPPTRR